jgi:hypothetical protein
LTEPERDTPLFATTTNVPVVDPAPERVSSAIQDVPVETDHLQSEDAVTEKVTVAPVALTLTLPGVSDVGQGAGGGAGS